MVAVICVLCIVCMALAVSLYHTRKQLSEWLDYLKGVKGAPERKSFIHGRGLLAEIHFEMNDILEENRKQLLKLTRAEEANKQILTNLSHDIRTPLASLMGYLEALEQGRVKEDKREEYLHVAYQKTLSLKELVDVLFEWFKIHSGEQEYQMKEYDVNELTRQIIIGYLPLMEEKNIAFEVHIPEEEWFLSIDKLAYERIINNLFSNALKHGKSSYIMIEVRRYNERVAIKLSNDGVSVSQEELLHLFDRLYKGDPARSQSGSGLGLAIVKELVTAMQGEITAESKEKGRISFSVVFPILPVLRPVSNISL